MSESLKKFLELQKQQKPDDLKKFFDDDKKSYVDNRFWKLGKPDPRTKKVSAIIKMLPFSNGQFYHTHYEHSFNVSGRWYIENSLSSIDQEDPVAELNSELWNSGIEANKEIARKRSRRQVFVSNILVIKDPSNPENNGKVFLYKYGTKIKEKLVSAINGNPELGEDGINPFLLNGNHALMLVYTQGTGSDFGNYDESKIKTISPLSQDQLEYVFSSLYDFNDIVTYKSYEELKKKLDWVLYGSNKKQQQSFKESSPTVSQKTDDFSDLDLDEFNIEELNSDVPFSTPSIEVNDDVDDDYIPF